MADITELFGLQAPTGTTESSNQADSKDVHPEGEEDKGSLVMTDYEYQKLQNAYEENNEQNRRRGRVWSGRISDVWKL